MKLWPNFLLVSRVCVCVVCYEPHCPEL